MQVLLENIKNICITNYSPETHYGTLIGSIFVF